MQNKNKTQRIGFAIIAFWLALAFQTLKFDWYRSGGDRTYLFWAMILAIGVYLATKNEKTN